MLLTPIYAPKAIIIKQTIMKTLEKVNGQKVWAVDDAYCQGCIFYNERCDGIECTENRRPDKRNVIFLPYEEKKKKHSLFRRLMR